MMIKDKRNHASTITSKTPTRGIQGTIARSFVCVIHRSITYTTLSASLCLAPKGKTKNGWGFEKSKTKKVLHQRNYPLGYGEGLMIDVKQGVGITMQLGCT